MINGRSLVPVFQVDLLDGCKFVLVFIFFQAYERPVQGICEEVLHSQSHV